MMKRSKVALVLFTLVLINPLYAEKTACKVGKGATATVICYGPADLRQTEVSGDVKVLGSLSARQSSMNSIVISGDVNINESTINGPVDVTGVFKAKNANFKQDMVVVTNKVILDHTTVEGEITISSNKDKPYLKLQCGTAISGPVIFNGNPGVVQLTNDSMIQGSIENGKVEMVKMNCPEAV